MIAPSKRLVVRSLGKHALGALGAFVLVAGSVVAVTDFGAGLALVAAGMGLLGICWGLTGRGRPPARIMASLASRSSTPAQVDEPALPSWPPGVVGEARAA